MSMRLVDICALLAAGSIGAGGTIAVQKVTAPKSAVAAPKRAAKAVVVPKSRIRETQKPAIIAPAVDCIMPSIAPEGGGFPYLHGPGFPSLVPGHGDGGWWPNPPTPQPPHTSAPIPEPASWAMLVAGFGLVGISMRRRGVQA